MHITEGTFNLYDRVRKMKTENARSQSKDGSKQWNDNGKFESEKFNFLNLSRCSKFTCRTAILGLVKIVNE